MDEAGERGLFIATSARYPPSEPATESTAVPLPKGVTVAQPSETVDGKGNGVYRLTAVDESVTDDKVLGPYRVDGTRTKVWEETVAIWDRAIARA